MATKTNSEPRRDGRLVRGDQTRTAILGRAAAIASVEGLEGVSVGRLASELNLSKSGVFAHWGSKEALQLATIEAAVDVFVERVVKRALKSPPGLRRVWKLCDSWLEYSREKVFPGGCFFASVAAEFDARPGPVHDRIARSQADWSKLYERSIAEAVELGEIDASVDPAQLAFELEAVAIAADQRAQLYGDNSWYRRARTSILSRLRSVATDPSALPSR